MLETIQNDWKKFKTTIDCNQNKPVEFYYRIGEHNIIHIDIVSFIGMHPYDLELLIKNIIDDMPLYPERFGDLTKISNLGTITIKDIDLTTYRRYGLDRFWYDTLCFCLKDKDAILKVYNKHFEGEHDTSELDHCVF